MSQNQPQGRQLRFPTFPLKGRHFISTTDFSRAEVAQLLDLAIQYKHIGHPQPLLGKSVALMFYNQSLRTRASMAIAVQSLGGFPLLLDAGKDTWSLEFRDGVVMNGERQEHIKEAVRVLSRYADAIGVRCLPLMEDYEIDRADPILRAFREHSTVPVLNLESAMHHPFQGMADIMTIKEKFDLVDDRRVVLSWASHPKALPMSVPNSFTLAATQFGLDLTIACPPEYELDPSVIEEARNFAAQNGSKFKVLHDQREACIGAEVIYAKSWGSRLFYGRQEEEARLREAYKGWIITDELMNLSRNGVFMHSLPVRRNVVVTDSVLDSPRSIVVDQSENRLHVQKAILSLVV